MMKSLAIAASAGLSDYYTHTNTIGPKTEQNKHSIVSCNDSVTCPMEAAALCDKLGDACLSFAMSPKWDGNKTAQLYTTGYNQSYKDTNWMLWSKGNDPPPAPPAPKPAKTCGYRTSMPCNADPAVDCGVRGLALEYSTKILPGNALFELHFFNPS